MCDAAAGRGDLGGTGVIVFTPGISESLYRIPAAGGSAVVLIAIDRSLREDSVRCPWFLPDGHHFLYTARNSDRDKSAIYVGDLESKEKRRVVVANSNAAYAPMVSYCFYGTHPPIAGTLPVAVMSNLANEALLVDVGPSRRL